MSNVFYILISIIQTVICIMEYHNSRKTWDKKDIADCFPVNCSGISTMIFESCNLLNINTIYTITDCSEQLIDSICDYFRIFLLYYIVKIFSRRRAVFHSRCPVRQCR